MQHSVSTSYLHIVYFALNATSIRYNSCRYVLLLCKRYNVVRRAKQALLHTFITSQFDFDFDLVVELTSFTQTDQMHEANVRMRPSAQPSHPTMDECNILDLPNRLYQFGEKVWLAKWPIQSAYVSGSTVSGTATNGTLPDVFAGFIKFTNTICDSPIALAAH